MWYGQAMSDGQALSVLLYISWAWVSAAWDTQGVLLLPSTCACTYCMLFTQSAAAEAAQTVLATHGRQVSCSSCCPFLFHI